MIYILVLTPLFFLSHDTVTYQPFLSISSHPTLKFNLSRLSLTFYYCNQSIYQMDRGSSEFLSPYPYQSSAPGKKPTSKWIKLGIPLFIVAAVVGIVVGAIVGTRKNTNGSNNGATGSSGVPGSASSAVSAKLAIGRFATATDSEFMVPVYPSTVSP